MMLFLCSSFISKTGAELPKTGTGQPKTGIELPKAGIAFCCERNITYPDDLYYTAVRF